MKITAVGIGTRGDVEPFIELGTELIQRGHAFQIATFDDFKYLARQKNVPFIHLDGSASDVMQDLVVDFVKTTDFVTGCIKLFRKYPQVMDQIAETVKGSDLVLRGTLGGITRHACELHHIQEVRVFYSPYDATTQYSLYSTQYRTLYNKLTYYIQNPGMNYLTCKLLNEWRVSHGLKKWHMYDDYRKSPDGKPIPTFYPVSPVLMTPDKSWQDHIHVTGYWFHPQDVVYEPKKELVNFLGNDRDALFIGFGKADSPSLAKLQHIVYQAVLETGIKAVVQAGHLSDYEKRKGKGQVYFLEENIPYSWIFQRVKGVVHHGGNTTNGIGLWAGCQTFIIPLALDQYYYGRMVERLQAGPKPLYIRKKLCTVQEVKQGLMEMQENKYLEQAKKLSEVIREENGCLDTCKYLEEIL